LIRTYLMLALVIGATIGFYRFGAAAGWPILWNIPVTLFAIVAVGALQHHLACLAHEAAHNTLFKSRYLNDLVGEWLCSFPMISSNFHYGLHHLAHHQFVNDPERDPDLSQLQQSGHKLNFPLLKQELLQTWFKQLWLPNLLRYSRARAEYDSIGTEKNPYIRKDWKPTNFPMHLWIAYLVLLTASVTGCVFLENTLLLAGVPVVGCLGLVTVLGFLPEEYYYQSRIRPLISVRNLLQMRVVFMTLLIGGLAWATFLTGQPWAVYFLLLWVFPLVSSFSFFMVLRQIVQHDNADRGWLTNTRVFHCGRLFNFSVFPLGQDFHLPHHMFATVPHYRLKELPETLLAYSEYQHKARVVEGYFVPKNQPATNPTVLEVLGPEYASREDEAVYIDNTVLDSRKVSQWDRAELEREGEREIQRARKNVVQDRFRASG